MAIDPKPTDKELTQDEQFILNAFFEAKRDAAKAAICFDLRPWVFMYDNKFVLMLKCPEGPVGEMTLVNSLHEATQLFGKDLFDQTKDHFDPVTKACYQILLNEPCYIVRDFRPSMVVFTKEDRKEEPIGPKLGTTSEVKADLEKMSPQGESSISIVVPDVFKPHLTCPICGKTNYTLFRNLLEVHRTNEILLGQYYCCSSHCGLYRGTVSPDVDNNDGIFCIPA